MHRPVTRHDRWARHWHSEGQLPTDTAPRYYASAWSASRRPTNYSHGMGVAAPRTSATKICSLVTSMRSMIFESTTLNSTHR